MQHLYYGYGGSTVLDRTVLGVLKESTLVYEEQLVFTDPYTLDVIKKTMEKGDYLVSAYIEYQLGNPIEQDSTDIFLHV